MGEALILSFKADTRRVCLITSKQQNDILYVPPPPSPPPACVARLVAQSKTTFTTAEAVIVVPRHIRNQHCVDVTRTGQYCSQCPKREIVLQNERMPITYSYSEE